MTNEIDWKIAPKGATHFYLGDWWKPVNGIMFKWEHKELTGSFSNNDCHWSRSSFVEQITEKMTPRPKPLQPTFTQKMADAGEKVQVGMEVVTPWGVGKVELIYMDDVCCSNEHGIGLSKINEIKPITPPIELIDGKAYQFGYGGLSRLHGIYCMKTDTLCFHSGHPNVSDCTDIKLLTVEVK